MVVALQKGWQHMNVAVARELEFQMQAPARERSKFCSVFVALEGNGKEHDDLSIR
jgi:hypothetical protein